MRKRVKELLKSESGAMAIVEATFVFPIMFFVIFFLIFMGNMYVSKAYTDNLINETAIEIAANCADPNLRAISADGKVTDSLKKMENEPYRYIFNKDVVNAGNGAVNESIEEGKKKILKSESEFNSFFRGMEPRLNAKDLSIHFKNNLVSYSLEITAVYKISMPWKFIFQNDINVYTFTAHAEVPVSDAPEFIRNVDLAVDYAQQSELVQNAAEKIKKLFGSNEEGKNCINELR